MPRKLPPLVLVGRLFSLLFMANRSAISRCPEPCTKPLGISDGRIRDDQMSASSTYGDLFEIFGAHRARLNLTSWPPGYRANVDALEDFTWIKITLDQDMVITGIATQGYGNTSFSEWVSNYLIFYEKKGAEVTASCVNTDGEVMGMCNGNVDSTSIRYHNLATPVVTKSVLVNPVTWKDNIGLRMELYGCEPEFHFVAVITIQKTRFKLDYANSTTGSYLSMRDDVIAEVTDLLDEVSGFLFAKLRTLSPQAVHKKPVMAAEVQIYCIESRKAAVAQELNNSVQNGFSSILGEFLYLEELFNCECDVPSVKVELGKTLKNATIIYTNSRFLLKATYNGNCKDDNYGGYELHWEVSKCEESTGLCNQIIPYGKNKPGRPKYLFPRLFGASYMYIRCVLKNHSQQTITYDYGYARITLPPLVAVIEGLSSVLKGNESVVRLDGSASYDPEVKHKNSEGLSFTWYCRREGAGQDDKGTIWTVSPKEVRVCHGTEFRHLNNSLATLTLDLGKLSGNNAYVFELLVQKGDRSTRTIHKLQVEPPFKLFIGCTTNCGAKVSANRRLTLRTSCSGPLCNRIARYSWSLFKMKSSGEEWLEVPSFEDKILTDIDSPNLVIPGDEQLLEKSSKYKIKTVVTLWNEFTFTEDFIFLTNSPPRADSGRNGCSATPAEGFVLTTEFNISCLGWLDDDLPLTYEFRYQTRSGFLVINSGPKSYAIAQLPLGKITLEARVSDFMGASAIERFQVQVKPIPPKDIFKLVETSTSDGNSSLRGIINKENVDEAAQMAYSIVTAVEEANMAIEDKQRVKEAVLEQISVVEIRSMQQVTQLSAVVVVTTEGEKDMRLTAQENAVGLLENMTEFIASQISAEVQNVDLVENIGGNLLQGISNSLSASAKKAAVFEKQNTVVEKKGSEDTNTDSTRKQSEEIAKKTLHLIDKLGSGLLETKVAGEKPSVYYTDKLLMTLYRQTPQKISGKTLGEGKGKVTLPSPNILFENMKTMENMKTVDAQMTSFEENPFTWDKSAKGIQSEVVEFTLKNGGTSLNISGLQEPIELFIPVIRTDPKGQNRSHEEYFVKPSDGYRNLQYHRIDIPSANLRVSFKIRPEKGKFLEIFVAAHRKPTSTDFQFNTRLPNYSSCSAFSKPIGYYNCASNPFEVSLSSNVTGKTGVHYIGIMHDSNTTEKSPSRVKRSCGYSGRRQKRSCIGVKDPPTFPPPTPLIVEPKYNESTDVNYTMAVTVTSCLYWSEKKQSWTNKGCSIGPKTTSASLHCLCNHLSAFGGDFFVAPNPIDFDKVWDNFGKLTETGNFVVLATVCSILGTYIVGLVIARRADKIDELKAVGNVFLSESTPSGCVYNVHVQTGIWKNQGTTAQVGIELYGEEGCSGPISLSDSKARQILFARGSLNSFTFALPTSLGRLFKILIWHDNSGESPAWFLQQVQVEDASRGDIRHFLANRWLALEKGSGEIEFEINAADKYELTKFKNLFAFRAAKNLGDGHLWLSVFTRPPHVAFTRCQRLSCCLSVLFTAMVTNAMFYNFGASPKDSFQVGPLKMSWTQIKIGIQSSLIAIPINILAALIFRNIKQKSSENVFDIRESKPEEKDSGWLPPLFVYIGWTICILTSLTSAAFIVLYSMMWGKETSNQWLTSVTVSVIQDVFVSQPIKVILLASLLSLIIRKPPNRDKVHGVTYQKSYLSHKTVAKPPQGVELEKARDFRVKVRGMYKVLGEITLFLTFVLLLLIVCYGNRSPSRYVLTTSMKDAFRNFKGRNISSFWTWVRSRLLPALYDTKWYNGRIFDYDEGFLRDRELFMIGMPRLRQIRIKPASVCVCSDKTPQLGESFPRCIPSYSPRGEYRTTYNLPEWIPVRSLNDNQSVFELERLCPKPWRYRTSWELKTLSYEGFYKTYDGGGYVADLGYNIRSALGVVKELQTNNWMDDFSTAVFVEFTIFNPSSSLFSVAKCLYERFPTGEIVFSKSVRTLTLFTASNNNYQTFHEVCQLLFMVLILFFIINEMAKIYRKRKKYFTKFWNWVEILQILTAICTVVMYFLKAKYTSWFLRKVRSNPFETSSADYIVLWSAVEIYVLSFLIFIVTMKFLRIIRFNRHVCQMLGTLARAMGPLVSYSVVFIATLLAYTQFGYLLFGSTLPPYSSFFNSLRAVLQMLLGGRMYFYEIKSVNGFLGPVFILLYMLTMVFILLNMFLAVLNESYFQVVEMPQKEFANADLGEFMIAYLIRNIKLMGRRLISSVRETRKSPASGCQSKKKKYTSNDGHSLEVQRLFTAEVQTEISLTCPIASMESFAEDIDDTDTCKIHEKNSIRAVIDSGSISLSSLLSIDEAFESDEDDYLEEVLLNVKSASYSSEFVLRLFPLRRIIETNV